MCFTFCGTENPFKHTHIFKLKYFLPMEKFQFYDFFFISELCINYSCDFNVSLSIILKLHIYGKILHNMWKVWLCVFLWSSLIYDETEWWGKYFCLWIFMKCHNLCMVFCVALLVNGELFGPWKRENMWFCGKSLKRVLSSDFELQKYKFAVFHWCGKYFFPMNYVLICEFLYSKP